MTQSISKNKSLLNQSSEKRFEHFVKRVADIKVVWLLHDSQGICLFGDSEEKEYIPVWPSEEAAKANAIEDWEKYQATSIKLDTWMNEALMDLQNQDISVAVFPVRDLPCVVIKPLYLRDAIQEELDKIE